MLSSQHNHNINFAESFLLSGTAAAISKTVSAPLERIKLLIQSQTELIKQGRLDRGFTSVHDCAKTIFKNEGIFSFWRGNLANVIRYFPQQALNFALKDQLQQAFKVSAAASYSEKFRKNILSGGFAGSLSLVLVQSIDYVRTRLAVDAKKEGGNRQFRGIIDCYVKTYQADGIAGLYRGFVISCTCIFIYRGLYFGLYDSLKPVILGDNSQWVSVFLLGWIVTITAGVTAYPLDTVRRRMMMTSGEMVKYKGSVDCFRQVVMNEGLKALFKGAGINVVRGVTGAGVLAGFDYFQKVYVGWKFE